VLIKAVQLSLFDPPVSPAPIKARPGLVGNRQAAPDDNEFLDFAEEAINQPVTGKVVKEFNLA